MGLFDDPFGFKEEKEAKNRGYDNIRQAQAETRDEMLRTLTPIHEFGCSAAEVYIDTLAHKPSDFVMQICEIGAEPYRIEQRSETECEIFDMNQDHAYVGHVWYKRNILRRDYHVELKSRSGFTVSDHIQSMGWIVENTGTRNNISFIIYDTQNNLIATVGAWAHDGGSMYIRTYKSHVEVAVFGILFAKIWEEGIRRSVRYDD